MAISLQKSTVVKVVGVSLVMLLAACSTDQRYKRQVSGDESYLTAPGLKPLNAPSGMILPIQNGEFDVRTVNSQGAVGKQLDIRPPVQPLTLLSGSRAENATDTSKLLLENSPQNRDLWAQVTRVLQDHNWPIASRQDASQTLTTDWIKWNRADEDVQFEGRYQISVQEQGYQLALVVKSLELQQGGKTITQYSEIQRYNSAMLNAIIEGLDKVRADSESSQASRKVGTLDVQSGSDDTGLPLLIVRAPYAVVWERLPAALEKVGMKVTDRSRPQGTVSVTSKSLSSSSWDALGAKDPELPEGDYKLQVGDLDNRSSLQFIGPKGHTLTQAQNDALVAVFQAAFSQISATAIK
ncbi:outer membrane protein assembly factor BamC [Yersinia pseudotuberculosis]|uniref:Outer membrane protein assembly factor BamC n=1 Tax=Yersinia pseudotuberculosis serotype O:3 (strain YPIII) TaxID=502800 RepID=A0A0H3B380_YERPY|nr:outer membrane protein assembly factor BamC [Yersinia pseudotuberculosis]AJJ59497.1 nlpB/DapX lipofamily protein [Yersinia pseudotuberculosis YPIII]AYW87386.1 outer membrane protein assembly factor BamC [Yersinia pseudotuberculosis]AYX01937.1 outer membrane protein assembly factor BamC [Yersinia pseudotuberculosis]AZA29694.1 outer membrane protein assembly factor BamC [Yersinia pseudotuberculosis]MBK1425545.1 outer membrane protein assembly factor BamC [Yersinia pseudotuberculosis]